MRDILFIRGFYPDEDGYSKTFVNGEWVKGFWIYGNLLIDNDKHSYIMPFENVNYNFGYLDACKVFNVILKTVGYYTGLKDKNGKKIFEGDVCNYGNYVGVISFDEYKCNFILTYNETDITDFSCIWAEELEVIGNIFENPELIKNAPK